MSALANFRAAVADFIFPEGAQRRDELLRAANRDALTGLANRRAFDLARDGAERDDRVRFIVFDANNFAQINKRAGHAQGDLLLCDLARTIQTVAGWYGYAERAFRVGGDEFVILCEAGRAGEIPYAVEGVFGVREVAGVRVSVSGTVGRTFDEADGALQARKVVAKQGGL